MIAPDYGEPWVLNYGINNPGDAYCVVRGAKGDMMLYDAANASELQPITAQSTRIVACVNACAGIPNKTLTAFQPGDLLAKMTKAAAELLMEQGYVVTKEMPDGE